MHGTVVVWLSIVTANSAPGTTGWEFLRAQHRLKPAQGRVGRASNHDVITPQLGLSRT